MPSADTTPIRDIVLIATGAAGSAWEKALPTLRGLGLEALDASFTEWHDEALGQATENDWQGQAIALPDETASRARSFFSHSDERPRFGADARSLALLEFWADSFPQAGFLFFYTRAETAVTSALASGEDPGVMLERWQVANRRLMLFQRRHRGRTILMDAEAAARNPARLADALARFGMNLEVSEQALDLEDSNPVERLIAREWLTAQLAVDDLEGELEASALPLDDGPWLPAVNPTDLVDSYLAQRAAALSLAGAEDKLTKLEQHRANLAEQLAEREAAADTAEQLAAEAKEDSELLLLQLHHVQEELEKTLFQQEEAKQQLGKLAKEKEALKQGMAEKQSLAEEIERRNKALADARQASDETQEENELLLLQLHQAQEELESLILQHQQSSQTVEEPLPPGQRSPQAKDVAQGRDGSLPQAEKDNSSAGSATLTSQAMSFWDRRKQPEIPYMGQKRLNRAQRRKLKRDIELVKNSGLFNIEWYLSVYPDVAAAGTDPVSHYLKFGAAEDRDPSPDFSTTRYLRTNPDVAKSGMNPLIHFIQIQQRL